MIAQYNANIWERCLNKSAIMNNYGLRFRNAWSVTVSFDSFNG